MCARDLCVFNHVHACSRLLMRQYVEAHVYTCTYMYTCDAWVHVSNCPLGLHPRLLT